MVVVNLTEDEAGMLCDLIEDEQGSNEYEHYWNEEQKKVFDEVLYKVKCGLIGRN